MADGTWIKMTELFKKISLATLLISFLAHPIKENEISSYSETLDKIVMKELQAVNYKVICSDTDQKTPYYEKYYEKISPLIGHLKEKGFQIDSLLRDPRFKIYDENKFKPPVRKKIPSLEEYKRALGYENKKTKISDFIKGNVISLESAEKIYGIDKYIISAVLGIESDFGKNLGKFNPFNSYFSMYANNYRKEFAKIQLEELLLFCEKNKIDVLDLKSSYAGAISPAQFLPSSLNNWFIGEDLYDMKNNIFSVANYLSHFKKKTGSIERSIFRYNPNKLYTRAVLDLAKDAEKNFSKE